MRFNVVDLWQNLPRYDVITYAQITRYIKNSGIIPALLGKIYKLNKTTQQ
jgi:hypothetical protein